MKNNKIMKKIFPCFILLLLIFLCGFVTYFKSSLIYESSDVDAINKDITELEWNYVRSLIQEDYLAAGIQSKIIAEEITIDLKAAYPDLEILKYEMRNSDEKWEPEYLKIMYEDIKKLHLFSVKTDGNEMIICTHEGIILDTSPITNNYFHPKTWDNIYRSGKNPELIKTVVSMLFNRSNSMLYWEYPQYNNNGKIFYSSDPSMQELHDLYLEYGMESLKYIQFLAPAYITETGDIFGVEDFTLRGVSNRNDKIIVIQTFNPYEQIMMRHNGELEMFNTFKEKVVGEYKVTIMENSIIGVIVIIMVMIGLYFMMIFNNIIFHNKDDNK